VNSAKSAMLKNHNASPTGFSAGPMPGTCGSASEDAGAHRRGEPVGVNWRIISRG
jgi:hypothetical protein